MKILRKGIAALLSMAVIAGFSGAAFASDLGTVLGGLAAIGNLSMISTKTDTYENLQKTINYYLYIGNKSQVTTYEGQKRRDIRASLVQEYKKLPSSVQNLGMFICDVRQFVGNNEYGVFQPKEIELICAVAEYAKNKYVPQLYTDDKGVVRDKNNNNEPYDVNSLAFRSCYVNPENIAKVQRIAIFPYDCIQYGSMDWIDKAKIAVCLQKLQAAGKIDKSTAENFISYCERYYGSSILKKAEEELYGQQ